MGKIAVGIIRVVIQARSKGSVPGMDVGSGGNGGQVPLIAASSQLETPSQLRHLTANQKYNICLKIICGQGWRQEFSDGGMTLPRRGLKNDFQDTVNAKNLRKNRCSPSEGG